jgi:hypothetical protein
MTSSAQVGGVAVPDVPTPLFIDGDWRDASDGVIKVSEPEGAAPPALRREERSHERRGKAVPQRRPQASER